MSQEEEEDEEEKEEDMTERHQMGGNRWTDSTVLSELHVVLCAPHLRAATSPYCCSVTFFAGKKAVREKGTDCRPGLMSCGRP